MEVSLMLDKEFNKKATAAAQREADRVSSKDSSKDAELKETIKLGFYAGVVWLLKNPAHHWNELFNDMTKFIGQTERWCDEQGIYQTTETQVSIDAWAAIKRFKDVEADIRSW